MKTLKLSYNQGKKVLWNNETVRVTQKGNVYYVSTNENGDLQAVTWCGSKYENITIKTDFDGFEE